MPIVEALVETTRAERYLRQLCDHLASMGHGRGPAVNHPGRPPVERVVRSQNTGVVVFDWGRCTLTATDAGLEIRAESDDEVALARAQMMIGGRIEAIGRRERLVVRWRPVSTRPPSKA